MIDLFGQSVTTAETTPQLSLATIGAKYTDGVSLVFPGQTEATAKHYRCNPDVAFAAGQRVLIARVSGSYVVVCRVGAPQ